MVSLSERRLDVPTFTVDNVLLGECLSRHIVDNGHRRVSVVLGPRDNRVTQRRLEGIQKVLKATGISQQVSHVEHTIASNDQNLWIGPRWGDVKERTFPGMI